MLRITLPISKSIAQRVLIRQAMLSLPLLDVQPEDDPEDVVVLRRALDKILVAKGPIQIDIGNNGTAMRLLTAYCAQRKGLEVTLDGNERMHERPIGPLVEALRRMGAEIQYEGKEGFPPLQIQGKELDLSRPVEIDTTISTQYATALLLIGAKVMPSADSPYIALTREIVRQIPETIERDWSAAAFWLERHTLGLCPEPLFPGLPSDSLQPDRVAPQLFEQLEHLEPLTLNLEPLTFDFTSCPDLYPAIAVACKQLGVELHATGTERLRYKESDRLQAIAEGKTHSDHRIAMALLAADLPCDNWACVKKSYPRFVEQLERSKRPVQIGLTGGIGSGKSTIAAELERRGYAVYDCDTRAKALILRPEIREQITALLGEEAYIGGRYNTAYVAKKVFENSKLLANLNAIVHPAVKRDIEDWAKGKERTVVESAILHSAEIDGLCRMVTYVDAPDEVRVARAMHRDSADEAAIRARVTSQKNEVRLPSDFVLNNDGGTPVSDLVDSLEGHIQTLDAMG